MSLTGKSVAPLAIMAAFLILAIGFGALQVGVIAKSYQAIVRQSDPAVLRIVEMDRTVGQIGAAIDRDLTGRCLAEPTSCERAQRTVIAALARAQGQIGVARREDPAHRADYDGFARRFAAIAGPARAAAGLAVAGRTDAARSALTGADDQIAALSAALGAYADQRHAEAIAQARRMSDETQATIWGTLAVGVLAALLGAGLAGWMSIAFLAAPLIRLGEQMNALALGRHDVRLAGQDRSDEIGAMVRALAVFKDTAAARARAESALAAANERADSAARDAQAEIARVGRALSVGEFAASLAHEINQPISAIMMNCDACQNWLSDGDVNLAEARAVVQRIARDAKRAGDVVSRVRGMLTNAKPDYDAIDLNALIDETLSFADTELRRWGVTVRREYARNLPAVVGDRVQLQQVVLNLISNAVDAMKSTPRRQRTLTVASGLNDAREALVTVRDRGVGLEPGALERLFTPFFTTKTGGIGLGLSISRSIVETHGGRLWATALQPQGASFNFTVRAVQDNVLRPAGFAIAPRPAVRARPRRVVTQAARPRAAVARVG